MALIATGQMQDEVRAGRRLWQAPARQCDKTIKPRPLPRILNMIEAQAKRRPNSPTGISINENSHATSLPQGHQKDPFHRLPFTHLS